MDGFSWSLILSASAVALIHTLLGPDHYLPFVMLARARGWSRGRAAVITTVCGVGHVLSSVLLGGIGVTLGVAVARLEQTEVGRGSLAAWALVAFGLAYGAWGARKGLRRARGIDPHAHGGRVHVHSHGNRPHGHSGSAGLGSATTFWTLFAIFVLGPCEPLIPLFMLPASRGRWVLALVTAAVFGVVTVATMTTLTLAGLAGMRQLRIDALARWDHALAGGVIAASGFAVIFLGL